MHLVNLYIIYIVLAVPAMALVRTAEEETGSTLFSCETFGILAAC